MADNIYFGEAKRRDTAPQTGGYNYSNNAPGGYNAPSGNYNNSAPGGFNNSAGGYGRPAPAAYGTPAPSGGAFAELDDGDGELPF